MKDFSSANNIMVASVMFMVMLLAGCGTNLTEQATQNTNKYKDAIDNAKQTSAQVGLKIVETAEEAYHVENGTYTSNIDDLKQYGDIPDGVTILDANDSSFRLKLEKNGQTYYYPEE